VQALQDLLCVRWYVAYSLSLRDLEEMMAERGLAVDHSTVRRWVIKLLPRVEKAFGRHKDYRAIKLRTRPMLGFEDFRCARIIVSGIETMHMIAKGQMKPQKGNSLVRRTTVPFTGLIKHRAPRAAFDQPFLSFVTPAAKLTHWDFGFLSILLTFFVC
jgi:transposase-like protein